MKWTWLEKMPTTNARIAVSLVLAIATGVRVLFDWNPPSDWLVFLTVWAGLDVLQFGAKRMTHKGADDESPAA